MKFIAREDIPRWLERLAQAAAVWTPRRAPDGGETVLFLPWEQGSEPELDRFTDLSAKHLLLPASEKLFPFQYRLGGEGEQIEIGAAPATPESVVLFGARACDARATVVLDALFMQSPEKGYLAPYYRRRRQALAVITLACTRADAACFCSSWEEGTASREGSDVMLFPHEDGYLAEAVTGRGEELIGGEPFSERDAGPPDTAVTDQVPLAGLQEKFTAVFSRLDFWEEVTARCISCGYCTYACPTCHCFNIFDEMRDDRCGERCRSWDACMFYLYTLETSGHNPRPTIAHRYRNRIGHKFSYYPENQGTFLCTGCGRCIRGCPVSLDIRDVLRKVGDAR